MAELGPPPPQLIQTEAWCFVLGDAHGEEPLRGFLVNGVTTVLTSPDLEQVAVLEP